MYINNSILIIFILLILSTSGQSYQSFSSVLNYTAQNYTAPCEDCLVGVNATKFSEIGVQETNNIFNNPLPAGNLIHTLQMKLVGNFLCLISGTRISISLGARIVQDRFAIPIHRGNNTCNCSRCHQALAVPTATYPGDSKWWPGFNYEGKNDLNLRLEGPEQLQISSVFIDFQILDVNPIISSYVPNYLPYSGSTLTLLLSNIFASNFTYYCDFIGRDINATVEAQVMKLNLTVSMMICAIPPLNSPINQPHLPGDADDADDGDDVDDEGYYDGSDPMNVLREVMFYFYPDVSLFSNMQFKENSTGPFPLYYYPNPILLSLHPSDGPLLGGTQVIVTGRNFLNTGQINCSFGLLLLVAGEFINSTHILCVSPASSMPQTVNITISQNMGFDFSTTSLYFTYTDHEPTPTAPTSPQPSQLRIEYITIGCVCGGVVFAIIVAIGCQVHKRRRRKEYTAIPDMEPNVIIPFSQITMKELVGRGSFGSVYRAYWKHTEVAVKKIHEPTEALIQELYDEAKLMLSLRHPNIVTFMAITAKPNVCLVTEYVSRGSLYNIIHDKHISMEISHIRKLAIDTCKGMAYLHGARIIHRDLKSHNLLVDQSWTVKVGDFGLSRVIEETSTVTNRTMTACGTPQWTAPEVIRNQRYTFKADVFSFGICLWEMLSREDPYGNMAPYQVVIGVGTQSLRPVIPSSCPKGVTEIIEQCWNESPDSRPEFDELYDLLVELDLPRPATSYPITLINKSSGYNKRRSHHNHTVVPTTNSGSSTKNTRSRESVNTTLPPTSSTNTTTTTTTTTSSSTKSTSSSSKSTSSSSSKPATATTTTSTQINPQTLNIQNNSINNTEYPDDIV
eukprot:TRINITY_DN91_c2_g1_i2.p1 TRINITY_DN91_c2_g1~~TRINITY_DN91_c2_g1_i2.p1  ORF type:complete len:849 (-),score=203.77 TRINITY_DN91_c2_g1_i2:474-3020(-)